MLVTGTLPQAGVLAAKAGIAVLLIAAGGAKLAGLRGFAGSVRLFVPASLPGRAVLGLSGVIAGGELAAGAASLGWPRSAWLNVVVLGICAGFLVVSVAGYARYRGRPCRCFGALSSRGFSGYGVLRAGGLVLAALAGLMPVPVSSVQLGAGAQAGLLAGAVLVAAAAFSAAAVAGSAVAGSPVAAGSAVKVRA